MHTAVYRYVHLFFSGFRQVRCRPANGIDALYHWTYQFCARRDTLVESFPWYVSAAEIAECLQRHNEAALGRLHQPLRIQIAGYSFGGYTAVEVCRLLKGTGVAVERLCLCDPVARRFGRLGWLRAANPCTTIRVPQTVRFVRVIRQRNRRWQCRRPFFWPAGHRVVAASNVRVGTGHDATRTCSHLTIDNSGVFRDFVIDDVCAIHDGDEPGHLASADVIPFDHRKAA